MTTLYMNPSAASPVQRGALFLPCALRALLREAAQVICGGLVLTAPAIDLDPALRRDLGLD